LPTRPMAMPIGIMISTLPATSQCSHFELDG
jgi:hypothetical protein